MDAKELASVWRNAAQALRVESEKRHNGRYRKAFKVSIQHYEILADTIERGDVIIADAA